MTSINTGTSMNDTSSLRSRAVNKTENGTTIVSGNDNSDKDLFLKLLVAQIKIHLTHKILRNILLS